MHHFFIHEDDFGRSNFINTERILLITTIAHNIITALGKSKTMYLVRVVPKERIAFIYFFKVRYYISGILRQFQSPF
jgi:hypothetical protein